MMYVKGMVVVSDKGMLMIPLRCVRSLIWQLFASYLIEIATGVAAEPSFVRSVESVKKRLSCYTFAQL